MGRAEALKSDFSPIPAMSGRTFEHHTCTKIGCVKLAIPGVGLCLKHHDEELATIRRRSYN